MKEHATDTQLILDVSSGCDDAVETLEQELRSVVNAASPRLYRVLNEDGACAKVRAAGPAAPRLKAKNPPD